MKFVVISSPVVWIEEKYKKEADELLEEILRKASENRQLRQAILSGLAEKILK